MTSFDIAVIGGGPAGLQAALSASRVHRTAVLFDSGHYRNATVSHMHNLAANDGTPPAEFRAAALARLGDYSTFSHEASTVTSVLPSEAGFAINTETGRRLTARALILGTGLRDTLPAVGGLDKIWGGRAAQCPFCHAHEFAGERIGILGGSIAPHMSAILRPVASELAAFTHADDPTAAALVQLDPSIATYTSPMIQVEDTGSALAATLADGSVERMAALFVLPQIAQAAPFAAQLGLDLNPSGAVKVNEFAQTSVPGVFAAGDMAHLPAFPQPVASVANSIAAGQMAASAAINFLISAPA